VKSYKSVDFAYAKVNLHLSVGPRRQDGYHSILSIFQKIDLHDTLVIEACQGEKFSFSLEGLTLQESTIEQAGRLFCEEAKLPLKLKVRCVKRIPYASGLGGGSSDAATTLMMLNALFGDLISTDRLLELGESIGSDVPFFMSGASAAIVSGRGEIVEPLAKRTPFYGLLITPLEKETSTREAYATLDAIRGEVGAFPTKEALLKSYYGPLATWNFYNDFRLVADRTDPLYGALDKAIKGEESIFSLLSGSGSAYCIFSEKEAIIDRLGQKIGEIRGDIAIKRIKSLHTDHSDVTVSV